MGPSILATKVLLCVLLACLVSVLAAESMLVHGDAKQAATYFCRFADLLPNDFPLVGIVLLDGGKQRGALLTHQHTRTTMSAGAQLTSSSANSA